MEASKGYENEPGIIIQGHMDMVAVKTDECKLDMEKEGLILKEENGYLYADGTSLGGDDDKSGTDGVYMLWREGCLI